MILTLQAAGLTPGCQVFGGHRTATEDSVTQKKMNRGAPRYRYRGTALV